MTTVVNDGQVVDPASNEEAYLTPKAVHDCVVAFTDHQVEQLWRSHNVTAHWVPTIKYPPFFMEQLLAKALPVIRQASNTEAAVAWILKCRKVWSIKSAAMFIIRLTLAKFLYEMVQPEVKPAKAPETNRDNKPQGAVHQPIGQRNKLSDHKLSGDKRHDDNRSGSGSGS